MSTKMLQYLPNFGIHVNGGAVQIDLPVVTPDGVKTVRLPANEWVKKITEQAAELYRLQQNAQKWKGVIMPARKAALKLIQLSEDTEVFVAVTEQTDPTEPDDAKQ